ncbi:MAG: hypothetical protein N2111_13880 [Candidatus Sumerlaeaceae bacterium]|nr:hypothetical protein [Candidatus Sumerlaeaceae bacterium]
MAVPMTTSISQRLFDGRISEAILEGISQDKTYLDVVKEVSHDEISPNDKSVVRTMTFQSLGPIQQKGETTPIEFDAMAQGFVKETAHNEYGLAVAFSRKLWDDALFGLMRQGALELGKSVTLFNNLNAARLYDNAFNTTYYTAQDGLALCSTSHTSPNSALLRSNKLAYSAQLSYSAIQELLILGWRQVNMRRYSEPAWRPGDPIKVIVQPEDYFTAEKILSERALAGLEPDVDTNSINVLNKFKFRVVVNPYMTGTGSTNMRLWFLQRENQNSILLVNKVAPERRQYVDNDTLAIVHTLYTRSHQRISRWEETYGAGD